VRQEELRKLKKFIDLDSGVNLEMFPRRAGNRPSPSPAVRKKTLPMRNVIQLLEIILTVRRQMEAHGDSK
jgi:hypothetical protein